jgi:hypothetical protein
MIVVRAIFLAKIKRCSHILAQGCSIDLFARFVNRKNLGQQGFVSCLCGKES